MTTVRGPTASIVEHKRPVVVENLYLVGDRSAEKLHLLPTLIDGRPNPEASRLDGEAVRGWRGDGGERSRPRRLAPRGGEVVQRVGQKRRLPAPYLLFPPP